MLETYFGIIEAIFIFSLAIAFYIWQMRDFKKEKEKAKADARARQATVEPDSSPKND